MREFTPEEIAFWRKRAQGWIDLNDELWIRAARKAMNGDWTELKERVELLTPESPPLQIVQE